MISNLGLLKTHSCSLNRILALGGIGFILLSLIIILITPSAATYEFSVYDVYPLIFWFSLFSAIMIGVSILLINSLFYKQDKFNLIASILMIMLANLILLFMPFIRGYLNFGSGDVLTHIGLMKDIIHSGYFNKSNMYPVNHILGVTLNFFSGLSFQEITMIVPAIFSIFFIVSCYILATVILSKQSEHLLILLFGSILMFGNNQLAFVPNAQAFMILPFILYLFFKSNISEEKRNFSVILVILCILIVFSHPLITIIIISILGFLKISHWFQKKLDIPSNFNININKFFLLMIILFCSWTTYLYTIANTVKPIFDSVAGYSESVSEFQKYSNVIDQVNVDIPYLIRLTMSIYGQSIILGILSLLCSVYIIMKVIKGERIPNNVLSFCLCFLTLFLASILMFFINGAFGFSRIYICALIFSIILIPSTWLLINSDLKIRTIFTGIGMLMILAAVIWISMFNLYHSPITKQVNLQVTKADYLGMISFYENRDESYQILEYGLSQYRMFIAIYGRDHLSKNVQYSGYGYSLQPPDHFNYSSSPNLGKKYTDYQYFLLTSQGKFFYEKIHPEFPQKWRFNARDFERLNEDISVQQIYNNGNLDVMLIG